MKEAGESLEFSLGIQRPGISVLLAQNSLKEPSDVEGTFCSLWPLEEFTAERIRYTELCLVFMLPQTNRTKWPDSITAFSPKLESSEHLSGCMGNLRVDAFTVIRFSQPW